MMPSSSFRHLGILGAVLGAILVFGGVAVGWLIFANLERVRGGAATKIFVVGIVSIVPAIGLTIVSMGLWQYIFGRANKRLVLAFVFLVEAILIIAAVIGILT
jgi:hypothetical protein